MSIIYINPYQFAAAPPSSYDPDAQAYITTVEAADGQSLEAAVKDAINTFVVGCKADGTWNAITGACILAGARTLAGALVPLKGPPPTNYNFAQNDYIRKTGLKGDGSTKYLDSNVNNNSLPALSKGTWFYVTEIVGNFSFMGWRLVTNWLSYVLNNFMPGAATAPWPSTPVAPTFAGCQTNYSVCQSRCNGATNTVANAGVGDSTNVTWAVYDRNLSPLKGAHRLSFYCIASAIDASLLDARVTTLMSDLAAAIP